MYNIIYVICERSLNTIPICYYFVLRLRYSQLLRIFKLLNLSVRGIIIYI